jgi:ribosomal protein L10
VEAGRVEVAGQVRVRAEAVWAEVEQVQVLAGEVVRVLGLEAAGLERAERERQEDG